jgi:hypothetical protein
MVMGHAAAVLLIAILVMLPSSALAQTTGIAGRVTDSSGAVIPGVTVEASSPVLIERTRSVVSDGEGLYAIVDVRPGTYSVTFTLAGFATIRRDDVQIASGFTATVNAEMMVGAVEETITVTGATPTVDLRNTAQRQVISEEVMEAIPVKRNYVGIGQTIPGTIPTTPNRASGQDVGGLAGERGFLSYHGTNEMSPELEGMSWLIDGTSQGYTINPAEVQEFNYQLSGHTAESPYGGIRINVVPKDGGNRFSGFLYADFTNDDLQSDNLNDELRAQGLNSANKVRESIDRYASLGGPLKRDRLWFFASGRYLTDSYTIAGLFYPKDPLAFRYEDDPARPAFDDQWISTASGRLTWQVTPKHKLSAYLATQPYCQCHQFIGFNLAPEAAIYQTVQTNQMFTAAWKAPLTNRLLFEASMMRAHRIFHSGEQPGLGEDVTSVIDLDTGRTFRSGGPTGGSGYIHGDVIAPTYKAGMVYVTGSHSIKVGVDFNRAYNETGTWVHNGLTYSLRSGTTTQITLYNTPRVATMESNEVAIYGQEQWHIGRLTANLGLRFQSSSFDIPEQHLNAGPFVPERDYPAVSGVPDWNDFSPRLGIVYDLLGDGKTAIKATANHYILRTASVIAGQMNPVNRDVLSATRSWTNDANRDYLPQESELGPLSNNQFGMPNTLATTLDPELVTGRGVRGYNWEFTIGVQRELVDNVSVNVAYFRRIFGNFTVTDNLAVAPENYDPYCLAVPADPRLPDGGGNELCGLYDLSRTSFGRVNNFVTFADSFGKQTDHFDGIDATVTARLPHRIFLTGGIGSGSMTGNNLPNVQSGTLNSTSRCFVVDSPQQLLFCDQPIPWQTQYKLLGTAGLPWNFDASVTFQSNPGPAVAARWTVTSDQVRGSLGRDLSAGVATVDLYQPGTEFGERMYQLDVKLSRRFTFGHVTVKPEVSVFNLLNNNTPLLYNPTYGPSWRVPTYILPARLVKFAGDISF